MKKKLLLRVTLILLLILFATLFLYLGWFYETKIDTWYAIRYGKVFSSFDIRKVDRYLSKDTRITYNGVTKTYAELRENVVRAFDERMYTYLDSYGHGDSPYSFPFDLHIGTTNVGIMVDGDCRPYYSYHVKMELKQVFPLFFKVHALSSDDDFFGYLFFGIKK